MRRRKMDSSDINDLAETAGKIEETGSAKKTILEMSLAGQYIPSFDLVGKIEAWCRILLESGLNPPPSSFSEVKDDAVEAEEE